MITKKINKHIEILRSTFPEVVLIGSKSSTLIQEVLRNHYESVGETIINSVEDLLTLIAKKPDLVFVGIKNVPLPNSIDKKLVPSDYLEQNGIQYVGSQKHARNFSSNKELAKQAVSLANLSTARYFMTLPGQYNTADTLPLKFPLFIKPPHLGSGVGIDESSVVKTFAQFEQKVETIFTKYGSRSLVEQYLTGREFTVAILEQPGTKELLVMPVEIITQANSRGDKILDRNIKHEDHEEVSAIEEEAIKCVLNELATSVFKALGGRDFGRVDIRMDADNTAYFIEANLPPGLGHGYFARACKINQNISYESMITKIAELGMQRVTQKPTKPVLVTT